MAICDGIDWQCLSSRNFQKHCSRAGYPFEPGNLACQMKPDAGPRWGLVRAAGVADALQLPVRTLGALRRQQIVEAHDQILGVLDRHVEDDRAVFGPKKTGA